MKSGAVVHWHLRIDCVQSSIRALGTQGGYELPAAPSEDVFERQRMNELAGSPCNRRKHRVYSFSFLGRFLFFACRSTSLREDAFLEADAVSKQRPDRGQQLAGQGDLSHLRGFSLL